ncbi:MAG TPA: glycosyltransferase family 4 protein [Nitrolancea sp.]
MRFLNIIQRYYPFRGGSERYFQAFSERFAALGADVHVVTSDAWDLEYFWDPTAKRIEEPSDYENGVQIQRVPVRHLAAPRLTHRAIRRLMAESCRVSFPGHVSLLRAGSRFGPWLPSLDQELATCDRPDLVNSGNIAFESMIAAASRYARSRDVPHIVTPFLHFGDPDDPSVRRYYTMPHQIALLRQADALMVLTGLEADFLSAQGIAADRIHVVGAGIDVASVTGGDGDCARARLGIDGPLVLALGAAAFDKGTVHLIQAISRLNRTGAGIHLVIAGPVLSEIDALMRSLPSDAQRWIRLLGFVSEAERRDLLAACDLLALPSRTESFGLVFMEAWANRKPVIGARAGAIPAVVHDGEDGILVKFGDVAALAGAIETLVRSPELRAKMGAAGFAQVIDESVWFERVLVVYKQVLATTGRVAEFGVSAE